MSLYPEVKNLAVQTLSAKIGVKETAHKILKMYIGVNDKAQLFYIDSADIDANIPANAVYLYNEGNEYTELTGGWEVSDEDSALMYTHTKRADCLEIVSNSVSSDELAFAGFATTDTCLPSVSAEYKVGIQYSFICDNVNDSDCYFCLNLWGASGGGTTMATYVTADSSSTEDIKIQYISIPEQYAVLSRAAIEMYLQTESNGYRPNARLKIYKVWYELNTTE